MTDCFLFVPGHKGRFRHYLDWFHITMRLTVMGQYAKGLDTTQERREETLKSLKHHFFRLSWLACGTLAAPVDVTESPGSVPV